MRAEVVERDRGGRDVDDRVDGPDLVEVDAVERGAVDLGFGAPEALERCERDRASAFRERRARLEESNDRVAALNQSKGQLDGVVAQGKELSKRMDADIPKHRIDLVKDDPVVINDGPFKDLEGKVGEIDEERGKVKVMVAMFGRETPVELDFLQIRKL